MAFRVLLLRPAAGRCVWRRLDVARGQRLLRCALQLRTGRPLASKPTAAENEWTLDLEMDPEEVSPAPTEEPRPPHSPQHHQRAVLEDRSSSVTHDNRLLFSVGKKLMTAPHFALKATAVNRWQRSPVTMEMLDINEEEAVSISDDVMAIGDVVMAIGEGEGGECEGEEEEELERVGGVRGGEIGEGGRGEGVSGLDVGNNRKDGAYSMRETRKFLRGRALSGSRLATPPSETRELQACLKKSVSHVSEGQVELLSTVPSVLGVCVGEVEGRVEEVKGAGFTGREAETVLLAFPGILEVDYRNVYEVCRELKKCIAGGGVLKGLIARHPFLFLLPVKQVEARLTVLKNVCRDPNSLGFLLHRFPILLFASLTPSTLHTITQLTSSLPHTLTEGGGGRGGRGGRGIGHSWVAKSIYHNLSMMPAKLELGPDVAALTDILGEFQLDPAPTLVKFPGFFKASYAHVTSLLDVLMGAPLYLDTMTVRTLLCSVPDQLVWSEDAQQLQSHLLRLSSLFTSRKECSEKVLLFPGLVLPQLDLDSWLHSLADHGFTNKQTALLVSSTPSILLQDRENEFIPRLKLILSVPDSSATSLMTCSIGARISIFSTPLNVLTERLNYVHKYKSEPVPGQQLTDIFAARGKEFAAFCGRSLEQVQSETGLIGVELKKFKSRKKSLRQRKPLIVKEMGTKNESSNPTKAVPCLPQPGTAGSGDKRERDLDKNPLGAASKKRSNSASKAARQKKRAGLENLTLSAADKSERSADGRGEASGREREVLGETKRPHVPRRQRKSTQAAGVGGVVASPSDWTYGHEPSTTDDSKTSQTLSTQGRASHARKWHKISN